MTFDVLAQLSDYFNGEAYTSPEHRGEKLSRMLHGDIAFEEDKALHLVNRGVKMDDGAAAATLLTMATSRGSLKLVVALLDKGVAGVNDRDIYDDTALLNAASAGREDVIRELHKRGADAGLIREGFKNAFYFANKTGPEDATYKLLTALYPEIEKDHRSKNEERVKKAAEEAQAAKRGTGSAKSKGPGSPDIHNA